MGPDAMFLVFWMLSFKPAFSITSSKEQVFFNFMAAVTIRSDLLKVGII